MANEMHAPAMPVSEAMRVGRRLVELCREQKYAQALEELYDQNAVSTEAMDCGPDMPRERRGLAVLLEASRAWEASTEVHSIQVDGPYPHDDEFIVFMAMDATCKGGPMSGQRMLMKEACHYTVKRGKIVHARFFYSMG